MWQRFTERARRVVFYAQEEAERLCQNDVNTEHLLLGLVRESDSVAARVFEQMGVSLAAIRAQVDKQAPRGSGRVGDEMQLHPRTKRVIDLAYDEARNLNNNYIGTEHLLLGLLREGEGISGQVLASQHIDIDAARRIIMNIKEGKPAGDASALAPHASSLRGRDFVAIADCSAEELNAIFELTRKLKSGEISRPEQRRLLKGKTLAMIFEKPSLRTRVSFEVGIAQLGGHAINLSPADIQLGKRETIADGARTMSRMVDIIMARTFAHETVTELAKYADVPVINGLSDLEHPCQALADYYTLIERKGDAKGLKIAFVGDGNNVSQSLMLLAAKMGTHFTLGCPEGYEPVAEITELARKCAAGTGARIEITHDPVEAVRDADVVETDVWASMGMESEAAEREKVFRPYQVNLELMRHAKPDAIFEHCLPAHRGQEVTDEVIDSPQSVVFDEAENRLHVQKAVMVLVGG